jgi:hypothetical protein
MGQIRDIETPIPLLTSPLKGEELEQLTSLLRGGSQIA